MSRPRLDAEQKKVSFSLAFSPHLDQRRANQNFEEQITAPMEELWMQERRKHGTRAACGESLETV